MKQIAFVGLDIYFGTCRTLRDFEHVVYSGLQCESTNTPHTAEIAQQMAQQVLHNALMDAGIQQNNNIGIWWVGEKATSLPQALNEAQVALRTNNIFAAVIAETNDMGTGAVVLAQTDVGQRSYALLEDRNMPLAELGYLELTNLPNSAKRATAEQSAHTTHIPTCALGSAITNLGAPFAIASLIKAALCLHHRTIPAKPDWNGPQHPEQWQNIPVYVASQSRPWLLEPEATRRYAGISLSPSRRDAKDLKKSVSSVQSVDIILSEAPNQANQKTINRHLPEQPFYLLPMAADNRDTLIAQLETLQQQLESDTELDALASQTFTTYQKNEDAPYALSLVGHDKEEVQRELSFAIKGVDKAFAQESTWTSPLGSYFTAKPLGKEGKIAFVYPGAFNSYLGMGRDLFQLFPYLHTRFGEVTQYASRATGEKWLYPRSLFPLDEETLKVADAQLRANPTTMIESGTSFAILYTALMREIFGVQPSAALGYSLGEVSMLWALGVWPDGDAGSNAWNTTSLFEDRLFGPKNAVREHWNLGTNAGEDIWRSYILKAPEDKVRKVLQNEKRVYLTIVNEKREVVIAGHPDDCQRVIETLDCHFLRVPFDAVIHNPAAQSEYAKFVDLYTLPTKSVPDVNFYSAADYTPLTLTQRALAHAMAKMTCNPVDFPRLVNTTYDEGARIFVELGPLGTCSRWIRRILRKQPHAVVPINKSARGDYEGILAVLAMLIAERVAVDVAPLYDYKKPDRFQKTCQVFPNLTGLTTTNIQKVTAESHIAFLQSRQTALRQTAELISMQVAVAGQMIQEAGSKNQAASFQQPASSILFNEQQLREFGTGDIIACFGSTYAHYRGRRMPRLPNGDLLCISRVLHIEGTPGKVETGASLVSEYDVPQDAWYYQNSSTMPLSILMETALQPCGVLSTYLGSMLPYPDVDFYFRNLDGEAELLQDVDVRGKTITNHTRLLSSTNLPGIILQKFAFELACEGTPFYRVTSSFGYFAPEAMQNQNGLDNGKPCPTWLASKESKNPLLSALSVDIKKVNQLDFLDKAIIVPEGGDFGKGYIYAEAPISPKDWFFACHFYQDPVMPGSLGVEAMVQALNSYAEQQGLLRDTYTHWTLLPNHTQTWKYRGQVTPDNDRIRLEVHIVDVTTTSEQVTLVANASLWKGDLRIYEVKGIGIRWEV